MYEGQPLVCMSIIEENWLEYLAYVKKQADDEQKRYEEREKALAEIDPSLRQSGRLAEVTKAEGPSPDRYYDISIHGFWRWYTNYKV